MRQHAVDEQVITVLNIRLSDEIVSWLDSIVEEGIYNSRSEAVRDFIRDFVLEHAGDGTGK